MGTAIGDIPPLAAGVAVSPAPITGLALGVARIGGGIGGLTA